MRRKLAYLVNIYWKR